MHGGGVKQVARWVALGALFLIPFTPLIVANSYFFPFITGKAFYFRILVEIAFAAWVVLAFLDKAYRPRVSMIGITVLAFVSWMFLADAFALNALKAFWSNFERMEGWVLLIHLLGFFFVSSTVLRAEGKWRAWFLTSLGISVILSGYAFLQLTGATVIHQSGVRIDASLGNSAYFAIYLLFNVFIALWISLSSQSSWLKWSLIVLASSQAVLIFFTQTRGAILGLVIALTLAAVLTFCTAGKSARRLAAVALFLILIIVGAFYAFRESSFVQDNRVLQRIASISLSDGSTRFTIWRMAFKGALERPLTGWGQEGFNYVFNKYYEPSLFLQEPWFDRAHNAFIDWLIAGGLPAFVLYLSLFGTALTLLWKSSELSRPERIALTAALVGYGVHNLFVFDNLYSYIYFFSILALVHSQVARPIERLESAPEQSDAAAVTSTVPIAVVVAGALIWYVNVPGMQAAGKLIAAISPSASGIDKNISIFEELAARPAFAAQEIREQLISFAASVAQSPQATNDQKERIVSLAASQMQQQIAAYPLDTREHLQLAYLYRAIGNGAEALKELQIAGALSPRKEEILIQKGTVKWDMGDTKGARDDFYAAYSLGPQFPKLAEYAAAGEIAVGDLAAADKILQEAFGMTNVDSDVLAVAYYRTENWPRLIRMWQSRAEKPEATAQSWFSLAAVYYAAGDTANAIKTINAAVERFPDAAAAGAAAIKQIEGK